MAEEEEYVWKGENPVPAHLIEYIDDAIKDVLPPGTQVQGISPSGTSYWARTAKIDATDGNGNQTPFFMKVHQFDHGKNMVSSEYTGAKALHSAYPELVPEPIAWGTYKGQEDVHFLVVRFYELTGNIPSLSDFPALLAKLQTRPEAKSKTGDFGFRIITYGGNKPSVFPLSKSWEKTFTGCLEAAFIQEEQKHGPDAEMTRLRDQIFHKVIPRLVRPLETEGRRIDPVLCHGDLWDGNASVDAATGEPKVFDPTPLYAHKEYDLSPWFIPRHRMTNAYIKEYTRHAQVSEPTEDFHDRGILYSLRFNIHASSLYEGNLRMRKTAMKDMRYLVEKYPDGYESYAQERGLHAKNTKTSRLSALKAITLAESSAVHGKSEGVVASGDGRSML